MRGDEPSAAADTEQGSVQSVGTLNPDQLRRITAEHRGFMYQHLYAVGCMLRLSAAAAETLLVERDEDLEVLFLDRWLYLQVKTRQSALGWADVKGSVEQFDDLRKEHQEGRRRGDPALIVIANVPPGPRLAARMRKPDWPADVTLLWPGSPQTQDDWLPPPGQDLVEMLRWCTSEAGKVPFGSLAPQTLVWKLAARVQYACTGAHRHAFHAIELPELCEQFVKDLQNFPAAPELYRPQQGEPALTSEQRVRLVTGFSGAGKTTWAAQAAAHCPVPVTYFDVTDLPAPTIPGALARDLAARHLSPGAEGVRLPSGAGLDVLRAVDRRLAEEHIDVAVVIDNIHTLPASTIRTLAEALPTARLILLGHPWPEQGVLEAHWGITVESLPGWNADTIAAAFAAEGCTLDYPTTQRVLALTGGLPLYVLNAGLLTRTVYASDGAALCDAIEGQTHTVPTAQELILDETFAHLTETASTLAGLLALAEVPVTRAELQQLATAAGLDRFASNARALRELASHGLTQTFTDGYIKLHDAVQARAAGCADDLSEEPTNRALHALSELLDGERDLSRFSRWMRVLARTGQTDALVDLARTDHFHQSGYPAVVRDVLDSVAQNPADDAGTRFDALDALLLWAHEDQDWDAYDRYLQAMEALVDVSEGSLHETAVLATKQFARHVHAQDVEALEATFTEILAAVPVPSQTERILRYNYAAALYQVGCHQDAVGEALRLASVYTSRLGLTPLILFSSTTTQLSAALPPISECYEDVKRLADCLALAVRYDRDREKGSLMSLPAMSLYLIARAWRSAVDIGQDFVDCLLEWDDIGGALSVIDQRLLPIAHEHNLADMVVPIRSQKAVVLAYSGDIAAAHAEMDTVTQYDLTPHQQLEVANQKKIIEQIANLPPASSPWRRHQ